MRAPNASGSNPDQASNTSASSSQPSNASAALPWLAERPEAAPGLAAELVTLFDEVRLARRDAWVLEGADDEALVRACLAHFFRQDASYAGFVELVREDWLKRLFAETKLLAGQGDRAAFETLYTRHRNRVFALVWRLCGGDHGLAEDLLQEAFVRAWQKLDSFRGDSRFATWLHRLTVNVALSDRRIRVRRLERETALEGAAERTASGAQDVYAGTNMDLEQAISRLPERARTVLVLFDVEGYSHAEIAELAGMAVGSSKAQLHRARKLLRKALTS